MSKTTFRCLAVLGLMVECAALSGCAGRGDVIDLNVRAIPASHAETEREKSGRLTVLVESFRDRRPQRDRLGVRTHFWGGVTVFNVEEGRAGDILARVLAEYLEQRGWTVGVGTIETAGIGSRPDVVISGQVLEFSVRAKSRFGSTLMTTKLQLAFKVDNAVDGTTATMNVDEEREDSVFWFDPEDLEALVNQTLHESLESALVNLEVTESSLRIK